MKRLLLVLLFLAVAAVAAWYYYGMPAPQLALIYLGLAEDAAPERFLVASGFVEARQVAVLAESSGRVLAVNADVGDRVTAGEALVILDASLLDAQIGEAEATVAIAQASLARAEAGARPTDLAVAEALVGSARARRDAAYQVWQSALLVRDNPQEIDLKLSAARAQVAVLEQRVVQAIAVKDAAELLNSLRERQVRTLEGGADATVSTPGGSATVHVDSPGELRQRAWAAWNLATTDVWTAWTNLEGVTAARDAAQQTVTELGTLRANPQQANVAVAGTEAVYHLAEAAVTVAERQLDLARAGASEEQLNLARTSIEQARRAVETMRVQRGRSTLTAPIDGTVLVRSIEPGEVAGAGRPLLSLAAMEAMELRVYVPEPDLGRVALGQRVTVTVDSIADRAFPGTVIWIADQAEFTPKNIQTQEERARTVYAVLLRIDNVGGPLKVGMPADATFEEE